MPFVANDQDDEEKQGNSPVSPGGGGAVQLAPSSGVGSASPGGSGATAPKNAGGSFATLNTYLDANQGQAAPLAGKITNQIGEQYKGLDQGSQGVLQSLQGQVTNAPGYTASDNDLIAKESAAPVSFANDANNVSAFQKQLTDSYGGPASAEGDTGFQSQQAKINSAISQGQAQTTTAAGRQQLIAQNSKTPTAGVTALNSAILSQDPNSLSKVQDAYKPFNDLVTNLNTGAQGIDKTIASEQTDAQNASTAAKGAITGQMTDLNTAVNNQLAAQQASGTAQNAAVKAALTSGTADPTVLSQLGISQDQWNTLTAAQKAAATSQVVSSNQGQFNANTGTANVDLNQWLTQQDPNAVYSTANTATTDQYDKAKAFQTLLGGLNLDTPQLAINPVNAAQAGTAPTNLNSFGYSDALSNTQSTAADERTAAQAYVDALQSGADEEHAQAAAQNAAKNSAITNLTALGTMGAAGPALTGSTVGQFNALKNIVTNPSIKSVISAPSTVVKGVESGVKGAINTVSNIFCFHPYTLVDMADGTVKPIYMVQVGDETRGGKVLATTRGIGTDFYWYNGVLVTAKHAVKEGGVWVRMENAKLARKFNYLTEVVCNLVTSTHRIYAHGNEFADEHETDNYENLSLDASLGALNCESI